MSTLTLDYRALIERSIGSDQYCSYVTEVDLGQGEDQ